MTSKGCAWIWQTGTRLFPLTPALSLGERENRPPLRGESNALGRAGVSALNRGAHGASENDARLEKTQDARSLSLRERVRVRGNETPPTKSAGRFLQAQLDRLPEPVACATQKQISRHARRTTGVNREAELVFRALFPPHPGPLPLGGGEGECFADFGGLIVILSSILRNHQ